MGNEGLYSVGKEWENHTPKSNQTVSFTGHLQLGLSRESLTKSSLSWTLQIPECASHVACSASQHSRVNREQVAKTTSS